MCVPLMAIVQARMGSSRFPGKSLTRIAGMPLLFHVIERLQKSVHITDITVATTTEARDDLLVTTVERAGIQVVRGSETNVLSRFALALQGYSGNYVVRVTGDAPFVDPIAIDRMYETLASQHADFFFDQPGEPSIHEGFEVFSYASLLRLLSEAPDDPVAREHVTGYFKQHPSFVTRVAFEIPDAERFGGARLSVDTPSDAAFVEAIYQRLEDPPPSARIADIVALLRNDPALLDINRHVHQKSLEETAVTVAFVCESGSRVGYGHLSRILALAEVLRDRYATVNTVWLLDADFQSEQIVTHRGIASIVLPSTSKGRADDLNQIKADVVVIDVLDTLSADDVKQLSKRAKAIALIDDNSERRLHCDMVFFPEVPQLDERAWRDLRALVYRGFDYGIVDSRYMTDPVRPTDAGLRILVSMGGSDPHGFSKTALDALTMLPALSISEVLLVIGPGFDDAATIALERQIQQLSYPVTIHQSPSSLRDLMGRCHLAMISFGVTAYEAAAMALPAVYICLSDDHVCSAQPFVDNDAGIVGGVYPYRLETRFLAKAVEQVVESTRSQRDRNTTLATLSTRIRRGTLNVAREMIRFVTRKQHDEKTILFVAGSVETVPAVKLAKQMGLHTVVSDGNPNAPCFEYADDAIVADTYNVAQSLEKALAYHRQVRCIDGVICVASDVPLTVATIADRLRLPGIPIAAAQLAANKLAMKKQFKKDGVASPWFCAVASAEDLRRIVETDNRPLIIKPVDSRGARGVIRLIPGVNLEDAFLEAKGHSSSGGVMVEAFIDGPQVSTESFVLDGTVYTPGFSDRNYSLMDKYAPFMIEDGGDLPSALPPETRDRINQLVSDAARSMGIRTGVVKGDIVVHHGEPMVIELAARLSGGYFCTHEIPLSTGVDFVGNAIRLAVGDPIDTATLIPRREDCICQRYLFPEPGVVTSIRGVEAVAQRPDIQFVHVRIKPGDIVEKVAAHPARAGMVIASGDDRQHAADNAERAIRDIEIHTIPR